jgi:predicted nucleic acid-binding protein
MVHPLGLDVEALQLCRQYHRLSVYDAHYLALAQRLECEFWTADEELVDAVRPGFPWVHALAEIEGASENP